MAKRTVFKRTPNGARDRSPNGAFRCRTSQPTYSTFNIYGNSSLGKYDFDGSTISLDGNRITVTSSTELQDYVTMAENSLVRSHGNLSLSMTPYNFDGTDWSVGATTLISGSLSARGGVRLTDSMLAVSQDFVEEIAAYKFTESVSPQSFSAVGSALATSGFINISIASLTNRVIICYQQVPSSTEGSRLAAYKFNGISWAQVGTPKVLGTTFGIQRTITGLSSDRIVMLETIQTGGPGVGTSKFYIYQFNGLAFSEIYSTVTSLSLVNINYDLSAISEDTVVVVAHDDIALETTATAHDVTSGFAQVGSTYTVEIDSPQPAVINNPQISSNYEPAGVDLAVYSISPATGTDAGGTSITLTGVGFTATTTVHVGGSSATSVSVNSDTEITCTTPSGSAGLADVAVLDGSDQYTLEDAFEYTGAAGLTITNVSPSSGPSAGGTSVTITGSGFTGGPFTVTFGGVTASSISVVNDTTATCTTPAGTGTVDVLVSILFDSDTLVNGFTYT